MKNLTATILAIALSLCLLGCHDKPKNADIEKLLQENLSYCQAEDMPGFLSTLDPGAPSRAQTEKVLQQVFSLYDLNYHLDSIDILSIDDSHARVRVVQTTTKVNGPAFKNNRITMVDDLVKRDGKWLIAGSTAEKVDYLD